MKPTQNPRHLASDDPRHGTSAGYSAHRYASVTPCRPCKDAAARYQRHREHERLNGRPRVSETLGFRRRIEALQAIGWSIHEIAARLGTTPQSIHSTAFYGTYVTRWRMGQITALYEELSMKIPTDQYANRRRIIAARKGYLPPLVWDDIDADDGPATDSFDDPDAVDEVKVQRVLDGRSEPCNRAERLAIMDRWPDSLAALERLTGWNLNRLNQQRKAVA